jgi:signal peptidase I
MNIKLDIHSYLLNNLWEESLNKLGACWAKVVSDSMDPVIKQGDQVLVEVIRPERVRFGDIVVFKSNRVLIIHRVIGKRKVRKECHFIEKGDANLKSSIIPAKDIVGRITIIKNATKTVSTTSRSGRLLQLMLACISYISLRLYIILRYCLRRGRSSHLHYGAVYNKFFHLLRRILQLFQWRFRSASS